MGCGESHYEKAVLLPPSKNAPNRNFVTNRDRFTSLAQVQQALRAEGLESSNLVIGVDFTKSNLWNGAKVLFSSLKAHLQTFGGKSLHDLTPGEMNPYQQVIDIVGRTLQEFDDDGFIPAYGFGDITTTDKQVFPFFPDGRPCQGFQEVLERYSTIAPHVKLCGPTSFAPLIHETISLAKESSSYHILLISTFLGGVKWEEQGKKGYGS
jgi:E3 ubiquitin-protein ligase RGLG